jgi:hydrophobic/amphiphilic exporter-1 (mainly G- bacteria), HAE1 family
MWLFFRLRFAFWVAMGLPVAFLGGLFLMSLLGLSINMITMVALLIALGLLMDDAIVIAENIATQLQRGQSALSAAMDGARQVAPGVIASFVTTVAVFGPLAFLEGNIGQVLGFIPGGPDLCTGGEPDRGVPDSAAPPGHALAHHERDPETRLRARLRRRVSRTSASGWLGRTVDAAVQHRATVPGVRAAPCSSWRWAWWRPAC